MGLSVGGGGADVSEDADLSGGGDDGLGGGGGKWWVRCRFSTIVFRFLPRYVFGQPGKEKW